MKGRTLGWGALISHGNYILQVYVSVSAKINLVINLAFSKENTATDLTKLHISSTRSDEERSPGPEVLGWSVCLGKFCDHEKLDTQIVQFHNYMYK